MYQRSKCPEVRYMRWVEVRCMAIADRVADADAQRILTGDTPNDLKAVTITSDVIVNKLYSDQEDGKLLRSLTYVFGHMRAGSIINAIT